MPRSEVDICNQALTAVGVSQFIQSLNENSLQAVVLRQFYHQTRDQVLEEFPWNFADSYVQLQDIGSPPTGWGYRYRYPSDCVNAREIHLPYASGPSGIVWTHPDKASPCSRFAVVEDEQSGGKAIITNLAGAALHYTKRIINPALYSAKFVDAFAYLLASKVAAPLSAKPEYAQTALQAYQQAILAAGASNMNEGNALRERESEFLEARL